MIFWFWNMIFYGKKACKLIVLNDIELRIIMNFLLQMYFITMLCHMADVTINFWNSKFVTFDDVSHVTWLFGKCGNLGFIVFIQLFSLQFESIRNKTRFRKPSGFEFSVEINFCWDFSFCQIAFLGSLLPVNKYNFEMPWKPRRKEILSNNQMANRQTSLNCDGYASLPE